MAKGKSGYSVWVWVLIGAGAGFVVRLALLYIVPMLGGQ